MGFLTFVLVAVVVVVAVAFAAVAIIGAAKGPGPLPAGNWAAVRPMIKELDPGPQTALTPTVSHTFIFQVIEQQYNTASASTQEVPLRNAPVTITISDPTKAAFVGAPPQSTDLIGRVNVTVRGVDNGSATLTITVTDTNVKTSTIAGSSRTDTVTTPKFETNP